MSRLQKWQVGYLAIKGLVSEVTFTHRVYRDSEGGYSLSSLPINTSTLAHHLKYCNSVIVWEQSTVEPGEREAIEAYLVLESL
jgi:hypothetical protein